MRLYFYTFTVTLSSTPLSNKMQKASKTIIYPLNAAIIQPASHLSPSLLAHLAISPRDLSPRPSIPLSGDRPSRVRSWSASRCVIIGSELGEPHGRYQSRRSYLERCCSPQKTFLNVFHASIRRTGPIAHRSLNIFE